MVRWVPLNDEVQLRDLLEGDAPVVIFKHSTRCSISSMVKNRLDREWESEVPVYYLDLIAFRNVSNLIAELSGVQHESPQLLIFRNGKCVYHASHTQIMSDEMGEYLK